jgi:pimeloyl-ACP methyl ester carboxylesterase/molybdopterin/thiamine biosynthesis adenylyltransferase
MENDADRSVYDRSFERNIGILTPDEQLSLRGKTTTIVGLGGIGGNVSVILARMGVGKFRLADFDSFELVNINRQYGAATDTVGQKKCDVVATDIMRINPDAEVTVFPEGFTDGNAAALLAGTSILVDAVDFYSIQTHLALHEQAREHGVFTLMGSPIGFSACLQVFDPNGMSITEYCGIAPEMDPLEKQLRYACGLVPALAHIEYYDVSTSASRTDFSSGVGPSIASSCSIAAGLVATEAVLIMLGRRTPRAIPHTFQFDPCTFRYERTFTPGGMKNYDPRPALERIQDKASLVPQVLDFLYGKSQEDRLEVNGARLFYRSRGKGAPVVLISPLGGDSSFWVRQVGPLEEAGFRVITFDARGTGISSPCPDSCSIEVLASDLIALLDQQDVRDAHLVGVALGGLVAIEAAARRPDLAASLVIASGYARADEYLRAITRRWQGIARSEGMEALFDACVESVFSDRYIADNGDTLAKLKTFFRLTIQDPESFCQQSLAGTRYDATSVLPAIRCPVLIVRGGVDRVLGAHHADDLRAGIPRARLTEIPEASHFMPWETADRFNREVMSFITAVDRERNGEERAHGD